MPDGHMTQSPEGTSRRRFLQVTGGAGVGLMVGFTWTGTSRRAEAAAAAAQTFEPNAFVKVAPDGTVTVLIKHLEMGQGVFTGLTAIVAEEMDADWAQMRAEHAPANAKLYNNTAFGPIQGTGGSTSVYNSWTQLRQAGATARALLVAAAAQTWGVPASDITVSKGVVSSGTHKAGFGELAAKAATLPVPADVPLKDPKNFTLVGTKLPRKDSAEKTTGKATFAIDVVQPGMLVAVVQRPPRFGATAQAIDAKAAKAVKGVVEVVEIPRGVAVLATSYWAAHQGREALKVTWDESKAEKRGTDAIIADYKALLPKPGQLVTKEGDVDAVKGAKTLKAEFTFPYLAHAPMEPLTCVVKLGKDGCEIWAGDQFQTIDQMNAAKTAGLKPEQVTIHTVYAGGSFGRRATIDSDYIVEGVAIAKALSDTKVQGGKLAGRPVKLIWSREDDIRGGRYRPLYVHGMEAKLGADGSVLAWQHRIVGQSIMAGGPFDQPGKPDATSVEGAAEIPYTIPNRLVDLHTTTSSVPVLWWRSVGSTHTAFAVETFLDELAAEAKQDPVTFRRKLMEKHPRHLAVLNLAVEKADWAKPLPKGWARGVAVAESFRSVVAHVVEVSQDDKGRIKVERVVCAVDCGIAVTPDVVKAQMEGGIGYGLGAIMYGAITMKDGVVDQSNFDTYRCLRIDEMPKVEVHIVPSANPPTGVGEPGVPPLGPAVANAIAALTGKRIRDLPFAGSVSV
ncbi:xanthine dehydrogenase family protein molybdopterin-binding subunit [Nitrospirillum viridazoti]|uniref:Isoquinoline 1-oxidoreductase beta subunit n=3 Tax=Nitrospirillum TaxID=1543705 RepID=A0A560HTE0_9PROT|nr:xanthine dehydrogenase family protein molybdopterin-binding subunit [Nitrospirillum amazonense]TWB49635.1 isoquinoline 1-oxidoreductase beta subunit [Nitrospirillum amazonense]